MIREPAQLPSCRTYRLANIRPVAGLVSSRTKAAGRLAASDTSAALPGGRVTACRINDTATDGSIPRVSREGPR